MRLFEKDRLVQIALNYDLKRKFNYSGRFFPSFFKMKITIHSSIHNNKYLNNIIPLSQGNQYSQIITQHEFHACMHAYMQEKSNFCQQICIYSQDHLALKFEFLFLLFPFRRREQFVYVHPVQTTGLIFQFVTSFSSIQARSTF